MAPGRRGRRGRTVHWRVVAASDHDTETASSLLVMMMLIILTVIITLLLDSVIYWRWWQGPRVTVSTVLDVPATSSSARKTYWLVCLLCVTNKKVKCAISHEEYRRGTHLPFLGLEPAGGLTTEVCDAWPVRRQTYGYLPSRRASPPRDRYQIILLYDRDTCVCVWRTCPRPESARQGVTPAMFWVASPTP